MNRNSILIRGALFLLFCSGMLCTAEDYPPLRKKLINVQHCLPLPSEYVKKHIALLEKQCPTDGNSFIVFARDESGRTIANSTRCWGPEVALRTEHFRADIENFRNTAFRRWTDNFIALYVTPGNLEVFDDASWSRTIQNAKVIADVAVKSGFRGILLDPEDYDRRKILQFKYYPEQGKSFAEAQTKMRERGRQFMRAVNEVYPDITILSYWLASIGASIWHADDIEQELKHFRSGLFPAFLNGILDEIGPEGKLVDLNEYYEYSGAFDHLYAAHALRMNGIRLIAPENRMKYRAQVTAGFPIYLDMYVNTDSRANLYMPPLPGGDRLDRLADNLRHAVNTSDEYVWIYGECGKWHSLPYVWEWARKAAEKSPAKGRLWEEIMPGITKIVAAASDPRESALLTLSRRQEKGIQGKNLARNPECRPLKKERDRRKNPDWNDITRGYSFWQDTHSRGKAQCLEIPGEGSFLEMRNTAQGAFLQSIPVTPGKRYIIQASCRNSGHGTPYLLIRWKNPYFAWVRWDRDVSGTFRPGNDGRMEAAADATAPRNAGYLVVLLGVSDQKSMEDSCRWTSLRIHCLDDQQPEEKH